MPIHAVTLIHICTMIQIQRVPKYRLWVQELIQNTPEYLPDHALLQNALVSECVESFVRGISCLCTSEVFWLSL